ncbi:hypothetical protein [Alistipes sp. ZOR0009]|uniref:hypothetical protein n=1 Tax=Alistipes sp. ZOR0009 TaxID=1339253 RepID=UPI000648B80F|nr:hypothetical protein [Alistipes sp. ZOR0009]
MAEINSHHHLIDACGVVGWQQNDYSLLVWRRAAFRVLLKHGFPPLVVWLTPRVLADGEGDFLICRSGRIKESAAVGGFVEG